MRNILISVLGSTPQILTETLWCLKVQRGIDIDEIVVITTSFGKKLIIEGRGDLPPLLGKDGVFEKFCKEFKTRPKFTDRSILVIKDKDGNELDDIRDSAHNECASDFITNVIREFSKRSDVVIHCSVAGGRKTMSVFAGLAMTLVGRKRDHLYHVLVSPPEVEGNPKFFYKPSRPQIIEIGKGKKISTDKVEIILAEIPFLRLGEKYKNVFPDGISYTELVERVQNYENLSEPVVKVDDQEVEIIGKSKRLMDALKEIEKYAKSKVRSVLLIGETGTGKELFARYFAKIYGRNFTGVNCASFPENLLESELFGHVKGAFTGAYGDKKGIFEENDGGIVFLDEISKTTPEFQSKLLRFLDSSEIRKVGSSKIKKVDVVLVFALNEEPDKWLSKGALVDFFNRISRHKVRIPALRERKEDIPLLVKHFLKKYSHEYGKSIKGVSDEVMRKLVDYDWMVGNVRELENYIADMVAKADEDEVILSNLPEDFEMNIKSQDEMMKMKLYKVSEQGGIDCSLNEFVKRYIEYQLRKNNWNIAKTAKVLDISRSTLYDKMRKLGIKVKV